MRTAILSEVQQGDDHDPEITYPLPTEWEVTTSCCCCSPCVRVHADPERYFWGHWERFVCMPVFVSCISIFTLLVWVFLVYSEYKKTWMRIAAPIEIGFTLVMFAWSYFGASCMDPGYLPFDWVREKRLRYTWQEQLTGLGVRQDQIEFAKNHRPRFASFSKSAGRFVIRADHICGWIANWVGKRNHKQFMLLLFYACLYTLALSTSRFLVSQPLEQCSPTLGFFADMCSFLEIMISMILLANAISNCIQMASNRTTIESWKNIQNTEGRTFREEVCGSSPLLCWLCPIPAFSDDLPFSGIDTTPVETV